MRKEMRVKVLENKQREIDSFVRLENYKILKRLRDKRVTVVGPVVSTVYKSVK